MTYCGSQVQVKAAMDASEEMFALDVFVVSHLVLRLCKVFFPNSSLYLSDKVSAI